jgi:hypothetical protein
MELGHTPTNYSSSSTLDADKEMCARRGDEERARCLSRTLRPYFLWWGHRPPPYARQRSKLQICGSGVIGRGMQLNLSISSVKKLEMISFFWRFFNIYKCTFFWTFCNVRNELILEQRYLCNRGIDSILYKFCKGFYFSSFKWLILPHRAVL